MRWTERVNTIGCHNIHAKFARAYDSIRLQNTLLIVIIGRAILVVVRDFRCGNFLHTNCNALYFLGLQNIYRLDICLSTDTAEELYSTVQ